MRLRLVFLASALVCACLAPVRAEPPTPLSLRTQVLREQIYDVGAWAQRVPYDLALPVVARAKLGAWLDGLELAPEVRQRVEARIASPVLVDEIIPFLLALRDAYAVGEDAVPTFEAVVRTRYAAEDEIPGLGHSLFAWPEPETPEEGGAGFALDAELAARLVTLYDALYLAHVEADAALSEEIATCARREDLDELRAAVTRTLPLVRELVAEFRARATIEGEYATAVDAVLADPKRLETVTAAGVEFLDRLVCRSYRVFSTRLVRERQLGRWLLRELGREGGGELWRWLEQADRDRRYGVLVVVDGLQGHLVESLAKGRANDPFLRAIRAEQRRAGGPRPALEPVHAPSVQQQTTWLDWRVERAHDDPRYLPFFRDLYRDDGPDDPRRPWGLAEVGISTTPTISVRNLPIAWTGAPVAGPGGTGVPNFHFVDRRHRRDGRLTGRPYYFFGNDALRLLALTREAGMRSLFERLPLHASYACAAQYDEASHDGVDPFLNLALGEARRDFGEQLCMTELRRRAANERRLRQLRGEVLDAREALTEEVSAWQLFARSAKRDRRELARRALLEIAELEQRTLPELLVYYNPWPDHFAHFTGPFADEILGPTGELARLDHWLGVLSDAYREGGVSGRTLFGMAGDHGLAPVFHLVNPEVVVFDALRAEGVEFRVAKISSDEGEGPKLNNVFEPPEMKGYDVVVASTAGGNYMLDFFRDQGEGWAEQPLLEHLRSLRLVAPGADGEPVEVDVVEALLARLGDTLDYLVVRETRWGPAGGMVRVIGPRDGRRAEARILRSGRRIAVRLRGPDLLDTDRLTPYRELPDAARQEHERLRARCLEASLSVAPSRWCSEAEWRALTRLTPRPDSVVQLAHLYDSDRAGTVNLFPREGVAYNSQVPGRHAGESFHEKDAFAGVWGAPVTRDAEAGRPGAWVNGQVPIAIYEFLNGVPVEQGVDGFGYPPVGDALFPEALGR